MLASSSDAATAAHPEEREVREREKANEEEEEEEDGKTILRPLGNRSCSCAACRKLPPGPRRPAADCAHTAESALHGSPRMHSPWRPLQRVERCSAHLYHTSPIRPIGMGIGCQPPTALHHPRPADAGNSDDSDSDNEETLSPTAMGSASTASTQTLPAGAQLDHQSSSVLTTTVGLSGGDCNTAENRTRLSLTPLIGLDLSASSASHASSPSYVGHSVSASATPCRKVSHPLTGAADDEVFFRLPHAMLRRSSSEASLSQSFLTAALSPGSPALAERSVHTAVSSLLTLTAQASAAEHEPVEHYGAYQSSPRSDGEYVYCGESRMKKHSSNLNRSYSAGSLLPLRKTSDPAEVLRGKAGDDPEDSFNTSFSRVNLHRHSQAGAGTQLGAFSRSSRRSSFPLSTQNASTHGPAAEHCAPLHEHDVEDEDVELEDEQSHHNILLRSGRGQHHEITLLRNGDSINLLRPGWDRLRAAAVESSFNTLPALDVPPRPSRPPDKLLVHVLTWNMNEQGIPFNTSVLLHPPQKDKELAGLTMDLYVVGTQEGTIARRAWELKLQETLGPNYVLLHSHALMGIQLCVFVRRQLVWYIRNVESAHVPTKLGGMLCTKGGVGIALDFNGTRLLFIDSHLAAHTRKVKREKKIQRKPREPRKYIAVK